MQALADSNREFRERYAANSYIAARAKAYELAARMQLAAPEAVVSKTSRSTCTR